MSDQSDDQDAEPARPAVHHTTVHVTVQPCVISQQDLADHLRDVQLKRGDS